MIVCSCRKEIYGKLYNFHWSFFNSKLKKDRIVSFSIPAFQDAQGRVTCPMAGECVDLCYARQGRYNMPEPKKTRQHNFDFLFEDKKYGFRNFYTLVLKDLEQMPKRYSSVRVHDSGDFFHEKYFTTWMEVARQFPKKKFFSYTKMISFAREYKDSIPDNYQVVQSVGGKQDHLIDRDFPHSVIFSSREERDQFKYENGNDSDTLARDGITRIGLVYHGIKGCGNRSQTVQWLSSMAKE